jgi:hypothetical protein
MSDPCRWAPALGTQVEVLLDFPIRTGSFQHKCWKSGTVAATSVVDGKQCACVEVSVVGVLTVAAAQLSTPQAVLGG